MSSLSFNNAKRLNSTEKNMRELESVFCLERCEILQFCGEVASQRRGKDYSQVNNRARDSKN